MSSSRFQIGKFDRITIGGVAYRLDGQNEHLVRLKRLDGTDVCETFSYEELNDHRRSGRWRYDRNWFAPAGEQIDQVVHPSVSLSALNEGQRRKLAWKENICNVIREMHGDGLLRLSHRSMDENRDVIEAAVNRREIDRHHLDGRPRSGKPLPLRQLPSTTALLRDYRRYRQGGYTIKLLMPRLRRRATRPPAIKAAEELIRKCICDYASPERPTKEAVVSRTLTRLRSENEARERDGRTPLKTFSRRTLYRRIDQLDPFFVAQGRYGSAKARSLFSPSGKGLPELWPMQRIEIDEQKGDVITLFDNLTVLDHLPKGLVEELPRGRRWLCVAIDAATRCIVGLRIAEAPTSNDAVRLISMCVTDKSEYARIAGATNAWDQYGGLGTVATDAGSAFQSDRFIHAVYELGGNPFTGPLQIPEIRGRVERIFGTINTGLMPLLPGRTFRSSEARGDYDAEGNAVLTDEDLLRILILWVVDVYHQTPHTALGGKTPAERWAELAAERFVPMPPDRLTRRVATGIEATRTLSKRGILMCSNHYLNGTVANLFVHSPQRQYRVRIDPDDIGGVAILIGDKWEDAPSVAGDLDGITLDAWRRQVDALRRHSRAHAEVTREVRENALRAIRETVQQRVDQLLPGSQVTSAADLDRLEAELFAGLRWASERNEPVADEQADDLGIIIDHGHIDGPAQADGSAGEEADQGLDDDASWDLEDD